MSLKLSFITCRKNVKVNASKSPTYKHINGEQPSSRTDLPRTEPLRTDPRIELRPGPDVIPFPSTVGIRSPTLLPAFPPWCSAHLSTSPCPLVRWSAQFIFHLSTSQPLSSSDHPTRWNRLTRTHQQAWTAYLSTSPCLHLCWLIDLPSAWRPA